MMAYDTNMIPGLGFGIFAVVAVSLFIMIVINIFICLLLQQCYQRIPEQFRKQQPNMVWLLLIPCFAFIWNFFVFPPLSKSFKAYFDSINKTDVGDCQESIGLAYSICSAASIVPYLGCLTGVGSLVLLIIFLIKTNDLKNQIPEI
jgi:hypothetical protein